MPKGSKMHVDPENSEPDALLQQNVHATTSLSDQSLHTTEVKQHRTDGATASQIRVGDKDRRSIIDPGCVGRSFLTQRSPEIGAQLPWQSRINTNRQPQPYEHPPEESRGILEHTMGEPPAATPDLQSRLEPDAHGSVRTILSPENMDQERGEERAFTQQTIQNIASRLESVSISPKSCSKGVQKEKCRVRKTIAEQTIQSLVSGLKSVSISPKSSSSEGALKKSSRAGDSLSRPCVFVRSGKLNARKQQSRAHQKPKEGEKTFNDKAFPSTSNMCRNKRTDNRNSLVATQHITTLQNRPQSSQISSRSDPSSSVIKGKNRTENSAKRRFNCKQCGKCFKRRRALIRHYPYYCVPNPQLQRLTRVHISEKQYECEVCKKTFARKDNLQNHTCNPIQSEKKFTCDICSKMFLNLSNLRIHSRIHSNEKPNVCEICSKRFSKHSNLQRHVLTHQERKL